MSSKSLVETAHEASRRRAIIAAIAALWFLGVQFITRPVFSDGVATRTSIDFWAVNAVVLLLFLATGGGLLNRRQLRELMQDEVSKSNYRTACITGFWIAMAVTLGLYLLPSFRGFTGREVAYLVVTGSTGAALLVFAGLELRALRE